MKKVSQAEFDAIVDALGNQESKSIEGLDISEVDFSKTDLTTVVLARSRITGAVFSDDQDFYGYFWHENSVLNCEFKSVSLTKANLQSCIFERCKFLEVKLFRAAVINCHFSYCEFSNISQEMSKKLHLIGCTINNSRFNNVDFSLASFTNNKFIDCEFANAKLSANIINSSKVSFQL